jgi:histidinol dehydrogenase
MSDRMTIQSNHLRNQFFEVKTGFKENAEQIIQRVKLKGKTALNNMNEFFRVKEKLKIMRMWVKTCEADAEHMTNKLDSLGAGMREATQGMANTLRTFADKEVTDYSSIEKSLH